MKQCNFFRRIIKIIIKITENNEVPMTYFDANAASQGIPKTANGAGLELL